MDWITDVLPEENRIVLIYDTLEGLSIGYYTASSQMFYDLYGTPLRNVCAWIYVPDKPKTFKSIQDTVRRNSYIDSTIKRAQGGTEDVQTQ